MRQVSPCFINFTKDIIRQSVSKPRYKMRNFHYIYKLIYKQIDYISNAIEMELY